MSNFPIKILTSNHFKVLLDLLRRIILYASIITLERMCLYD
jgi:hypothetical protein